MPCAPSSRTTLRIAALIGEAKAALASSASDRLAALLDDMAAIVQ